MRKIGVVTVGRSDFGLLYPLISSLKKNKKIKTFLFAGGGHFSKFSGNTEIEINKHNLNIDYKINCSTKDDSKNSTNVSLSRAIYQFAKHFKYSKIDYVILLGDRYEMLGAAISARNLGLKIFHIGGGCSTLGALDDMYRHSISIMSDYHFVDLPEYKNKLKKFGIKTNKIFTIGSFGAANVTGLKHTNKKDLFHEFNISHHKKIILFTYHPTTKMIKNDSNFVNTVLNYLKKQDYQIIISNPNEDFNRNKISELFKKYKKIKTFKFYKNLGHENYASFLRNADLMIGNSSSGILEAASFNLPVLNLGIRQKGRIASKNVFNIEKFNKKQIEKKINDLINLKSKGFKSNNIYFKKNTYKRCYKIIISKIFSG